MNNNKINKKTRKDKSPMAESPWSVKIRIWALKEKNCITIIKLSLFR